MVQIGGARIPFWGAVMGVWTALKLKKEYDDYREVASDEAAAESGRIRLPVTPLPDGGLGDNEDAVSLLNTGNPRRRDKKKAGCCMCCGLDCSLFWKAFGIVAALWALYAVFSGIKWLTTPSPTGLEDLPEFGTSLTCKATDFFYRDAPQGFEYTVPVKEEYHDHTLKLGGSGMGTLIIKNAPMGVNEVQYKITMHGSDRATVDASTLEIERPEQGLGVALRLITPVIPRSEVDNCIRFDIVMSVPSNVKILNIHSKATLQMKWADEAVFDLKTLSVVLFKQDEMNILRLSEKVFADSIDVEAYRGWIVGETTITKGTSIVTQRSTAVTNVKVHPAAPEDPLNPEPGVLHTTTGLGRTDIFYVSNPTKRPIHSKHYSSQGGDVYLNYQKSRFSGKIAMSSKNYAMSGVKSLDGHASAGKGDVLRREEEWTHYVGDVDGKDKMEVMSLSGWVGLYF